MRQDLNDKLIPIMEHLCGLLGETNTSRRARDDDGTRLQRRALRDEADDLRDGEDEVTANSTQTCQFKFARKIHHTTPPETYVRGLSCSTFPFFRPLI